MNKVNKIVEIIQFLDETNPNYTFTPDSRPDIERKANPIHQKWTSVLISDKSDIKAFFTKLKESSINTNLAVNLKISNYKSDDERYEKIANNVLTAAQTVFVKNNT